MKENSSFAEAHLQGEKPNRSKIALIAVISGLTCKRGERVNSAFRLVRVPF